MRKVEIISEFGKRLKEAFQNARNKEIAKALGVSGPAVTGYMTGSLPSVNKLIEISAKTGYSIDWLLTGVGERILNKQIRNCKSILVCGYKRGVGTSLSTSYIALSLALKGKKVLVVDNKWGHQFFNFNLNYLRKKGTCQPKKTGEECRLLKTDFENIELFIGPETHISLLTNKLKTLKESIPKLVEDYDYIICDISSGENPFRSSELTFNRVLEYSKVLIPYEPCRSNINDLKTILGFIESEKMLGFQGRLLGVFISNEKEQYRKHRISEREISQIKSLVKDRVFTKVISNFSYFEDLKEINTDENIKENGLLKDYFELTDEILITITSK